MRGGFLVADALPGLDSFTFRSVSGGFKNLTSLVVPELVCTFLSLGPKFMLPSFSLMCDHVKQSDWDGVLGMLEAAGYCQVRRFGFVREDLESAFIRHVSGGPDY